MLRTHSQVQG